MVMWSEMEERWSTISHARYVRVTAVRSIVREPHVNKCRLSKVALLEISRWSKAVRLAEDVRGVRVTAQASGFV